MGKVTGVRISENLNAMIEEIMVSEGATKSQVIKFAIRYLYSNYKKVKSEGKNIYISY